MMADVTNCYMKKSWHYSVFSPKISLVGRGLHMLEDRTDYFLLAYDSPTFSAAVAKVPMSPQGFTKIIKNLERDLGVPLFQNDEHGVRQPTAYADEFYRYAKHLRSERELLETAFNRITNEGRVEMNVACAVGIPGLFGSDGIMGFSKQLPNVTINFSELPDSLCDSLVAEGVFDVGISLQPASSELSTHDLLSSQVYLWMSDSDPLYKHEKLTLDDISDRSLAMPGKEFRCYKNLQEACKAHEVKMPTIIEYAEIFWIYYYVLAGKGLGFCLPHLYKLDIFSDSDHVKAIPLENLEWRVCFTWPKKRVLASHEEQYRDYLAKQAKRLSKRLS